MNSTVEWFLITAGLLACLILAAFILRQMGILKRARLAQDELEARWNKQHAHLVESVRVLARCMLEDQMELSEGCIRIKVLLDTLAPELNQDPRFHVFQQMYDSTEHMPTHEARQQTDKRFVRKMDRQRHQLEQELKDAILQASKALLQVRFDARAGAAPSDG